MKHALSVLILTLLIAAPAAAESRTIFIEEASTVFETLMFEPGNGHWECHCACSEGFVPYISDAYIDGRCDADTEGSKCIGYAVLADGKLERFSGKLKFCGSVFIQNPPSGG